MRIHALLTWNYRVVAQANYASIAASDMTIASIQFFLIKKVSESKAAWLGYTLGGTIGSVVSAWITKQIHGQ